MYEDDIYLQIVSLYDSVCLISGCDKRFTYVATCVWSFLLYMLTNEVATNHNGRVPGRTTASVHTSGSTTIHGYTGSSSDRRSSSSSTSRHFGSSCSDPGIVLRHTNNNNIFNVNDRNALKIYLHYIPELEFKTMHLLFSYAKL